MDAARTPDAGPFYHGTRADLKRGDLIVPGHPTTDPRRAPASWVHFSATLEAAVWAAELAGAPPGRADARQRIYIVEPTGEWGDDPDCAERGFAGNPTRSYRSAAPLRIVGEVAKWRGHPPERLAERKAHIARRVAERLEAID